MRTIQLLLFLLTATYVFGMPPIPLSQDATDLYEALSLDWSANPSNCIQQIPAIGAGTNAIANGVSLWQIASTTENDAFVSFGMECNGVICSGNLTLFPTAAAALADAIEGEVENSLPRSFLSARTTAIPGIGDGCLSRHDLLSPSGEFSDAPSSLHFFSGNVGFNLFAPSPTTNLTIMAQSLVSFVFEQLQ
jgi:hypothetical protein